MDEWSGEVEWSRASYAVEAGEHNFHWVYEKNPSNASGDDEAWVDFIVLPSKLEETLMAYAGNDAEICAGITYTTDGFAVYHNLSNWQTSGTGGFDDASALQTVYTPSPEDYEAGEVFLILTAYSTSADPVSDTMTLSFSPLPSDAGSVSGSDEVCNGTTESYMVDPILNAAGYNWNLMPEEAGILSMEGNMVTIEWDDNYIGEATLKVQGVNECGSGEFSDELVIMVDECSAVGENSELAFGLTPNPSDGTFTVSFNDRVQDARLLIKDLAGRTVHEERGISGLTVTVRTSGLQEGVYLLTLENSGTRSIKKLVIQH
jgi:hypothetical protein